MSSPRETADFALASAHAAVDHVAAFMEASDQPIDESAEMELASRTDAASDYRDRATWEHHAALSLLIGARTVLKPRDGIDLDDDEATDTDVGYRLLSNGDLPGTISFADALLEEASNVPEDDWNYGNLVHHAHILLGKAFLEQNDVRAAAVELIAAGAVSGSPQLDTFGPDLSLAWALLRCGEDEAVLNYLRQISRFWSPDDPVEAARRPE